ncbi:FMN-dependent NADH-azoreductase [Acinetobacter sp. KB005]|uniref:FMN-dependent NADH-azoreductase n=1 Tax=Acinetobacter sp. KB005 TaxID=3416667 RepID=UPI003CF37082
MMSKMLHIDASVRAAINPNPNHNSISKNIASRLVSLWKNKRPMDEYIYRDLGMNPPPFITQDWIDAVFTPENKRTQTQCDVLSISDQLIAEVSSSDIILISSPMYNYGMPAQLKAWFDQIIRINKTFDFDLSRGDFPLQPLLSGKILIIITSSGEFGFEKDGIRHDMNHLVPHLRTLSKYLGVEEIYEIASEYQEFGDERHIKSLENAFQKAEELVAKLAGSFTKKPQKINT